MRKQDKELELLAVEFRQQNGLTETEAIRFKSLLLKNKILTLYEALSNDFSGMAVKTEDKDTKRFILVNSNHTRGRQHFTICHELYHLYFQENFKSEKSKTGLYQNQKDPEEYNADLFASYLLLPENGIFKFIPSIERTKNCIKLNTILSIENYYSCSRSALLYRLKQLKLIDGTKYDEYNTNIKRNAIFSGFETSLYEPGNQGLIIGNYGILAKELFEKGDISESSYFSFLEDIGVDLSKIEEMQDHEEIQ